MKIVFLDASTVGEVPNLDSLKSLGDVTLYPVTKPAQTAGRISDADVVITNKVVLYREQMEDAPKLKLICVAATGMNNIDKDAAKELGIEVKNVAGYASQSVAQSTFAIILHLIHRIPEHDEYVKGGKYSRSDIFAKVDRNFHELSGMRFGIIGLGNIGSKVAEIAKAFGCEIVYYSTSGKNRDQPYKRVDVDELLKTSDIISIHAPLNANTENLLGYDQLKMMKPSAILVNTGRGGIVNEKDLACAIDDNLLAGAAIDVFEKEPISPDNPLLKVTNTEKLLLTPHITWSSVEARTALIEGVRNNIEEFLEQYQKRKDQV